MLGVSIIGPFLIYHATSELSCGVASSLLILFGFPNMRAHREDRIKYASMAIAVVENVI